MRAALSALAGLAATLAGACGGRAALPEGAGGEGGASASPSSSASGTGAGGGGSDPHAPCASADGVRLCGGDQECAWLEAPDCPGFGCTPTLDRASLRPSGAGVCWADTPNKAALQCDACLDGQVCAQRSAEQLVCVSPEVCEALWDAGAVSVCRYADKSAYDHQPLPSPAGECPGGAASAGKICGGACGPCEGEGSSQSRRCTGRSPLHPYGVCAHETAFGGSGDPAAVPSCTIAADGTMLEPCATPGDITYCAVFEVPPDDLPAARRYGVCLRTKVCLHAASALPGGIACFDDAGQQVAP